MEDTPGSTIVNGSAHNFIWAENIDFVTSYGMLCPLVICLLMGLAAVIVFSGNGSRSIEVKQLWKDVALFTFLALCQMAVVWAYIFMTPYFASGEMQIAMLVVFFAGPPIMSYLLFADSQGYRDLIDIPFSQTRKMIQNALGISHKSISCDSVSDVLFPIKYILAHIVFITFCLVAVILSATFYVVLLTFKGLLVLFSLQTTIKKIDDEDVSLVDLLQCILIHLISFSIPELVMVLMNINLPNSPESEGLTITFIVLVGLECLFGIFYLVKWLKVRWRAQSAPSANPSFTIQEVPIGSDGVQMTRPFTSTAPTMPIKSHTVKQEAEFSATSTTGQGPKVLDDIDDSDDDLEEPPWINPSRYQYGTSAQTSFQRHAPMHTGSLRHQSNDFGSGSGALECPICYISGNKKKVISCGHMLCENCLEGLKTRTGTNLCPFCHQEITQALDLYF